MNYFMKGEHRNDLNRYNELGFRGEIADEFSVIIRAMWGGMCRIISPRRFKYILGQFNQQFVSNEQQDAQELLLFLLDGLHEDLNRVISIFHLFQFSNPIIALNNITLITKIIRFEKKSVLTILMFF